MSDGFQKPECENCKYLTECPCRWNCCCAACLALYKPRFDEETKEQASELIEWCESILGRKLTDVEKLIATESCWMQREYFAPKTKDLEKFGIHIGKSTFTPHRLDVWSDDFEEIAKMQKEIVYRYTILSDSDVDNIKRKFPDIDIQDYLTKESTLKLLEQLEEKSIEREFLQALRELK